MKEPIFNNNNQVEVLSFFLNLKPEAIQGVLLERSKQAALAFGVELLEEEVEKLRGASFARKTEGMCWRGGLERNSMILSRAVLAVPFWCIATLNSWIQS